MHSIIDSHVHLYPTQINKDPVTWGGKNLEPLWVLLSTRKRKDGSPVQLFPNPKELLLAMDDAGIEHSILMGWYWETARACEIQNTFYKKCIKKYSDRFSAFGAVHLKSKQLKASIIQLKEDGFIGLGELSPHAQGVNIKNKGFTELLNTAAELRMPVNFHVSDPDSNRYPGYVETPLEDFVFLIKRFPETTFILAHAGGLLPAKHPEIRSYKNVYYDTAALPLLYDSSLWPLYLKSIDSERILFGSDYPLRLYPMKTKQAGVSLFVQAMAKSSLGKIRQKKFFSSNAKALLKL